MSEPFSNPIVDVSPKVEGPRGQNSDSRERLYPNVEVPFSHYADVNGKTYTEK